MQYIFCKYCPGDVNSLPSLRISEEGAGEGRIVQSSQLRADASVSALCLFHVQQGNSHLGDGTQSARRPLPQTKSEPAAVGSQRVLNNPSELLSGDLLLLSGNTHFPEDSVNEGTKDSRRMNFAELEILEK